MCLAFILLYGVQRMCVPTGYHQLQITFVFPFPVLKRWLLETLHYFSASVWCTFSALQVFKGQFSACSRGEDFACRHKPQAGVSNPLSPQQTSSSAFSLGYSPPPGDSRDAPCRTWKWLGSWLCTNCIKSTTALCWPKWLRWIFLPFTVLINSEFPLI